jgi:uncharacterized protein YjdB
MKLRTIVALSLFAVLSAASFGCTESPAEATDVAEVATISVAGTAPAIGATAQFTATATLSDGTTRNINSSATWGSSNTSIATVSSSGIVTGARAGSAVITATYQGVAGSMTITIS